MKPENRELLIICCVGILRNKTNLNIVYIDVDDNCFIVNKEKILFTKTAIGLATSGIPPCSYDKKNFIPFMDQCPNMKITHHLLSSGIDLEIYFTEMINYLRDYI